MRNIIMKQTMTFMRCIVLFSLALIVLSGIMPAESAFAETLWSAQKGSVSDDYGKAVAFYNASSVYMAGYTYNAIDGYVSLGTGADLVLLKYNPSTGARQWTVQKGLSGYDVFATGVAVDSSGNVYVTGYTNGGLDGYTNAGSTDLFLMKYNSSGSRLWTRQLGSTSTDYARSVIVDASGNIYVTGETYGGLDGNTNAGYYDLFVVKYDSAGTKQWTRQLGTSTYDYGKSVSVDTSGNVYVAGHSAGAFAATNAGNYDIILVKYNSAGTLLWSQQLGSSNYDYAGGLAVDTSGNSYVAGYTAGGLDGNTGAGSYDIFLTKYSSAGVKQWTRQTGTSSSDLAYGVSVDNTGSIFVSGYSAGSLDGNTSAGYEDIVLVKYNSTGVKMWTQQYGSSNTDVAYGVDIEPSSGDAYVTGYTYGNLVATNAGVSDIFFTKFNGATEILNNVPVFDAISATATQAGWDYYYVDVPYGAENLVFNLANQTNDADLYVRYGSKPDLTHYDCRPFMGGTGNEQCNFSVPSAGRWWIAVNNYSIGTLSYSIESEWVSVAPTGSISVNSGAAYTTSPYVTLNLACTDNIGCAYMQFTNDYVSWSPVETYNTSYSWTLTTGDGLKYVDAYFRDSAGNWSYGYYDYIILDTTPPTGTVSINSGASITNNSAVTLNLSCTDANGCSQMQFSNDFVTWSSVLPYSTSASWTLAAGDGAKYVYVYFKDNAGNWSGYYYDQILLDTTLPTGTVSINSGASITSSASVTLSLSCSDGNGCSQMQFSNDNVTYSSAVAYATSASWTMATGDGTKTVYVKFKDNAGNWMTATTDTITLDTTPPSGSASINSGATYTTSTSVTLTLACIDSSGCSQMQFSNDNVTYSSAETYSTSKAWMLAAGDGTKTVYAKFKDSVGNWSSAASDAIVLDTAAPAGSFNINSGATITNSASVSIDLSCSGCSQMQFSNDNATYSSPVAYAASALWTMTTGDGTKTVYVKLRDAAGNWSSATSDTIILDTAAPAGSVSINSGASVTGALNVTLNLSCSDGNGCSEMQFSNDNITYSSAVAYATSASWTIAAGDGTKTVYARFMDASGNWSFASSDTIVLDTIAPAGLITINFGDAYASMTAGILLVSCNDDNGCAQMQFSNDNVTYSSAEAYLGSKNWTLSSGDGTKTVYAKFRDSAGNWSSAVNDTIVLDTTVPSGSVNINSDATTTNSASVTLNLSCIDTNGCSQMQFSNDNVTYSSAEAYSSSKAWTLATGDGTKTLFARFSDSSGNWSSATSDTIVLDTTVPSGTVYINSDASATSATNVTLNLSCTDTNGCSQMQFSSDNATYSSAEIYSTSKAWTLSAGDGTKTVYVKFKDTAGNWSLPLNDTITLDTATPIGTIGINSGASYTSSSSVTLALSCTDGNGCSQMQFSNDNVNWTPAEAYSISKAWTLSSGDGTKTVSVKFSDSVGNWSASTSAAIVYDSALPSGSISINSDAALTNLASVTLTISCTDSAGCAQMQFSNDNSTWSSPEAYSISKAWTLPIGDGSKTVYAKLKDNAGNWSSAVSDTIMLDTALPTGTVSINSDANYASSTSVTLSMSCTDANGCSQMQFSNDNVTYSPAAAYATSSSWTIAAVNGAKTVYVKYMDSAGNWSAALSDTIVLDTTAPAGSVNINSGATLTGTTSVSLTLSCTDATSGCGTNAEMQFSNDNVSYSSPEAYSTSKLWSLTLGDGTKTVYVKFKDSAGNWSSSVSHSIVLDTIMPSGSVSINSGAGSTNVTSVSLTLACTDTNVCTEMQFSNDNVSWSTAEAYATSKPWTLTSGDGSKTVFVKFKDGAGNWSLSFSSSITLNTVASAGLISINSDANYATSASVTISLTCTDGSGCSEMQFSDDNISWSVPEAFSTSKSWTLVGGSGINTVYAKVKNTLGSWSASVNDAIVLDTTAPSGTVSVNSDAASTTSASVSLSLSCTDGNGCSQMQFSNDNSTWSSPESYMIGKSWTLATGDGTKTVYVKFKDTAGNWSSASSDTIVVDTTAPAGSVNINSGDTLTSTTAANLTLSCTDSTSGCSQMQLSNDNSTWSSPEAYSTSKSWTLPLGDGTKTVYSKFQDSAGNWSSSASHSIVLDATMPSGTISINSGAGIANAASVALTLACTDTNSCTEMQFSNDNVSWSTAEAYATSKAWTLSTGDGSKTVYAKFKDTAGNWSLSLSSSIVLSTVASTGLISINSDANYATSDSVTLSLTCTDGSGCSEMQFSSNNISWTAPEAFATSKSWLLMDGSGINTVYAMFKNTLGIWSASVNDTIVLDMTAPLGTVSINSDAASTTSTSVSLTLSCTDANGCSQMQFSNDDVTYSAPESYSTGKSWTLSTGDATKWVYVKFKDSAGNWSSVVNDMINLDATLPVGTVNIDGSTLTGSTAVNLTLSCTDDAIGGCSHMQFSNDNSTWSSPETYSTSKSWTLTIGDGTKTVYAKFKDSPGNWSSAVNDTVVLDTTAPSGSISINSGAPSANSSSVSLTLSCTDTNVCAEMQFSNDNVNWSTAEAYSTSKSWTLTNEDGSKTVYAKFKDAVGNWSLSFSNSIVLSTVASAGLISINSDANITTSASVTLTLSCTDGNGCSQMQFSDDNSTWSSPEAYSTSKAWTLVGGDGINAVHVKFKNTLGAWSLSVNDTIVLDTTSPSGAVSVNSADVSTNSTSVSLTLSCTDANGCTQMQFSNDNSTWSSAESYSTGKSWTLASGDGTKTVYVKLKDSAGNWSSAVNDTIVLDTTMPAGTVSVNSGAPNTYSTSATLSLACTDANGCSEMQFSNDNVTYSSAVAYATSASWTLTSGDGTKTVYVKFKDSTGNWSSAFSNTILLDMTLPTGTVVINADDARTSSALVTLALTCTDANVCAEMQFSNDDTNWSASEAYATSKTWTLGTGDGTKTVYVKFKDTAGNWSLSLNDIIVLDTILPTGTVIINTDASFTNSASATLTLSCTDANGCVEMKFSNDDATWSIAEAYGATKSWILASGDGSKTVYAQFKDTSGNWSSTVNDTITLDTSVPTGTISIDSGITSVNNVNVLLTLTCTDSNSCAEMKFSTDNSSWSSPETYGTSKAWTLASGDGAKTVYVIFKDPAGNWSSAVSNSVILDTALPSGSINVNSDAVSTNSISVSLALSCNDSNGCSQMQFSNDDLNWSSLETYAETKAWTLSTGDGTKTVYAKFKDFAGNWSSSLSDAILLDSTAPTGTLSINSGAAMSNSTSVTLTLSCTDANSCSEMKFSNDNTIWSGAEAYATTKAWTLTIGDGTKTIYAQFKDTVGNWSVVANGTILLDTANPTGAVVINSDALRTNSTSVALTLSCTDANGCSEMQFSSDNAAWSTSETYAMSKAWTLVSGDGTNTVFARFKDSTGNWSSVYSDTIILDMTLPTGSVAINSGAAITNSTAVTLTLVCSDSSTCSEMQFSNDNAGWSTAEAFASSKTWTMSSGDGSKTVYAKFKDGAGNWSMTVASSIALDTIAPAGSISLNSDALFTTSTSATLALSCLDPSACAEMQFSNDNATWSTSEAYSTSKAWALSSGDGNKTVYAKFKDGAGNWSLAVSDTIKLDTTAPSGSVDINSGNSSTSATSVTLTLTCTDANGCVEMKFSNDGTAFSSAISNAATASWAITSGDATKTVYAMFKDSAGNWSSTVSDTIVLDTSAPTGSLTINDGISVVNTNSVTLTLTCSDSGGCAEMQFSNDGISYSDPIAFANSSGWTLPSGDGTKTVYAQFKDSLGNWSATFGNSVILDTELPTGTVSVNLGAVYTNVTAVTLTLTCLDTNGCSEMRFSNDGATYSAPIANASDAVWTLFPGDGTKTVYAEFKDSAGNWSVASTDAITLDSIAPLGLVSINSGAGSTTNAQISLSMVCSDANGCSEMQFSNDNTSWSAPEAYAVAKTWTLSAGDGTKTAYVKFKDSAGNWTASLNDAITLDSTLPTGTVNIESGALITNATYVTLTLTCADASGCSEMQFSNDDISWSMPIAYSNTAGWTLPSVDGVRTVYAKLKDSVGNWSLAVNDTIMLDSTPPIGTVDINSGASLINASSAILALSCTDASGCAEMQFSNDDISWSAPEAFVTSKAWTLPAGEGAKTVYARFKDTVGLWSTSISDTIILDTDFPTGAVNINSGATITNSTSAALTLTCTDANGCAEMQLSSDNVSWSTPEAYSTSKAWSLTTGDGVKTVYAKFKDTAGNWSVAVNHTIMFDGTAPAGSVSINSGAAITNSTSSTLTLACTDSNGCAEMQFSNDNASWSSLETYATSKSWSLTTGDGTKTVYAKYKDTAGNWSNIVNHSIVFDSTAPTATVNINSGATITNSTSAVLTLACTDANGCAEMQFSNDNSSWSTSEAYATSKAWSLTAGDATKTVYAMFKDTAGNWSAAVTHSIMLDTASPTGSVNINAGATITNSTSVALSLTCTDANGCAEMQFSNDNSSWSTSEAYATSKAWSLTAGDATKTVYAMFKDTAGNWSAAVNHSIMLDTALPAGTIDINSGVAITNSTSTTLTLTCTDASGCVEMQFSNDGLTYAAPIANAATAPWTLSSGDGAKTVYAKFKDTAGNWSVAVNHTIIFDGTAPVGSLNINSGATITNSVAISLTLTCTDANGCSEMQFSNDGLTYSSPISNAATASWTLLSGDAMKTVYAKFKDTAGNWSMAANHSIMLDTALPTGSLNINAGAALINSTSSAVLTLTCTDANGCSEMQFSNDNSSWSTSEAYATSKAWTLPTGDGTKTVYAKIKDTAGNWSSAFNDSIVLDTTLPTATVLINSDAAYATSSAVNLTLDCTDANGCAEMQFSADNAIWSTVEAYATSKAWTLLSADGSQTVYARFKDSAGNWSLPLNDTITLDTIPPVTTASPAGGTYTTAKVVALTCTDGGSGCGNIYYTLDGSTPTVSSAVYATPLDITQTATLKFFAKDTAGNKENANTDVYTLNLPPDAPTGLTLSNMKTVGPAISWNSVAGATGYKVYRSSDNATWGTAIANASGSFHIDTNAPKSNTLYYWTVTALNASGESSKPTAVSGRTALIHGWNQVSAPFNTTGATPSVAYGSWTTWTWGWMTQGNLNPDRNGYWYQNPTVEPGFGQLLWAFNDSTVLGASGAVNVVPFDVILKPGWNQISNPISANLTGIGAGWLVDGSTLTSAISNNILGGDLYWWNGITFDSLNVALDNPVVEPWKCYWILNLDSVDHTLTIK